MPLLNWKPEYSLGIESVDSEHRQMIGMINDLHQAMDDNADRQTIEHFLGEIHAAISAHFALEEREMRKHHYSEFAAHKDDHEELLDQIRDLMDVFERDRETGFELLQQRLSAWFEVHFKSFDARLHGQLGSHGR